MAAVSALVYAYGWSVSARSLPSRLSDEAFWRLIDGFSEPNGYFRSDNFLSNETAFQQVIPDLAASLPTGGVYIGVGPEQNFTYVVAFRPKLAFIVDIRRQNMVEHLLYKAFIELSSDRADFLSRLFARSRPEGLTDATSVDALFEAYRNAAPSEELFRRHLEAARRRLVDVHKFALSPDDLSGLHYVYSAFFKAGPDLSYSFSGFPYGSSFRFPTYADLMTETDGRGEHRSYLATEENFRILAEMERNNAVVPLTGDFAGPKALRSIGRYLKSRGATVTVFYTSNVEQYLFQQQEAWKRFFTNVATLPIDSRSTFIRSVSNRGFQFQRSGMTLQSQTRVCTIAALLKAFDQGQIATYFDVVSMSK
jgi:hypothetical protein